MNLATGNVFANSKFLAPIGDPEVDAIINQYNEDLKKAQKKECSNKSGPEFCVAERVGVIMANGMP
jgi:hypothetical protein